MMSKAMCNSFNTLLLILFLRLDSVLTAPISLGSFRSRQHQLQGTVRILSERVIEVTGFIYDGTAPAAYFWIDASATPSRNGRRLLDATPSNSCGVRALPRGSGETYIVEFPPEININNYLGGSISVWCEAFFANFGEVVIPATLSGVTTTASGPSPRCSAPVDVVPDITKTPTGFNCEPLNDQYQVRWAVMGNDIAVELVAVVSDTEWMGFGISGSTTRTLMDGADPTIVDMYNGVARARDFYINNRSQCSGVSGVCPDTRNGRTDDVQLNSVSGERKNGITLVRYIRPLTPTDSVPSDRSISVTPGVSTYIVWAIGPVSPETGLPQFHTVYPRGTNYQLEFGRTVKDNCSPLVSTVEETPAVPYQIPTLKGTTEFVARIGPSGGDRGYAAITSTVSWGIAWYMNDLLIPVIEMRRGTKYTFRISGGNTPNSNSEYHPMYLTTSASGGYAQISPEERARETVIAGITVTQRDSNGNVIGFESPLQAPICQYQVSDATFLLSSTATFQDYYNTLDRTCSQNSAITNAAVVFEFTPTNDTPDQIYYQCVTHRNLGWKVNVLDALAPPPVPIAITPPVTPPAAAPVTPPVSAPVTPPAAAPVTPPVSAPVTPPAAAPVTPPVIAPVTPPAAAPVTPPVSAPVTPPTAAPVTPPVSAPVTPPAAAPVTPPVIAPVTPPATAPVSPPVAAPVTPPATAPVTTPLAAPVTVAAPSATVPTDAPTRKPCGLLGLSIFCLNGCGLVSRILGLCRNF